MVVENKINQSFMKRTWSNICVLFMCVEHDTHLVQKTVPQVFTAKCSEPQAVIREDMSERSG